MAETAPRLRLVPPEADDHLRALQTFAVLGMEEVERALAALAADGRHEPMRASSSESEERWLDTADHRILAAGLLLRVGGAGTARLSPLATVHPLPTDREGFVQVLPPAGGDAALRGPGPVGTRVADVAGARVLETLATVRIGRRRIVVKEGEARLRVDVEELRAVRPLDDGERVAAFLTIAGPDEATVASLAAALREHCDLIPPPRFAATVLGLTGVPEAGVVDLGPSELRPHPTLADLAFATLRADGREFLLAEPKVRLGEGHDAVHDMRVAARRLRAALALFRDALPARAKSLRRELRRFGEPLGRVRDLEVQLTQLDAWRRDNPRSATASFDAIERVLRTKHAVARRKLLRAFEARRYERLVVRLTSFLREGPKRLPATGRLHAVAVAPELIRKRYRKVRRVGDALSRRSTPAQLHELRIACKSLRYALDFYRPLYDGAVASMTDGVSALQSLLGDHQDMWVAIGHLEELAAGARRKLPPQALFLMGAISAQCERRAAVLRRSFPRKYGKIRGRRKRSLRAALRDAAASVELLPRRVL